MAEIVTFAEIKERELATAIKTKEKKISLLIILLVFVIAFGGLIIKKIIDIRLDDISNSVSYVSSAQEGNRSLYMLVRYFYILERAKNQSETEQDYLQEAMMQMSMPEISSDSEAIEDNSSKTFLGRLDTGLTFIASGILNSVRFIFSKEEEDIVKNLYENEVLKQAYNKERNRKFQEAIDLYNSLFNLDSERTNQLRSYILVHAGFCYAQLNELDKAIDSLQIVIDEYPGTPDADVSDKLLNILLTLKSEKEALDSEDLTDLEKGKRLFFLAMYKDAAELLDSYIAENPDADEARFYVARSEEEMGNYDRATDIYTELSETESEYASNASNRLYMIDEVYDSGEEQHSSQPVREDNQEFVSQLMAITATDNQELTQDQTEMISNVRNEMQSNMQENMSTFVSSIESENPTIITRSMETQELPDIPQVMAIEDPGFASVEQNIQPPPVQQPPPRQQQPERTQPQPANNTQQQESRYQPRQLDVERFRPETPPTPETPTPIIDTTPPTPPPELEPAWVMPAQQPAIQPLPQDIPEDFVPNLEVTLPTGEVVQTRLIRTYGGSYILVETEHVDGENLFLNREEIELNPLEDEVQNQLFPPSEENN